MPLPFPNPPQSPVLLGPGQGTDPVPHSTATRPQARRRQPATGAAKRAGATTPPARRTATRVRRARRNAPGPCPCGQPGAG